MSIGVESASIRLSEKDHERLAVIKNILGTESTSEIFRRSLELSAWVLNIIEKGGSVYIRRPEASVDNLERVVILGAESA